MPDGTIPSSSEALRSALASVQASLQQQLTTARSDATEDALRQLQTALDLLPGLPRRNPPVEIADAEWSEAPVETASPTATPEPSASPPDDDLTRIRGIDDVLAKRLAALGIQRYAQIAAWQAEDVRVIADAMGLGRRFLAMGVVDQAAALLRERETQMHRHLAPRVTTALKDQTAIAVWLPPLADSDATAPLVAVTGPASGRPLDGYALQQARRAVRTRHPPNRIFPLAQFVPALGEPIFVATNHDASVEVPHWRTGALVPFVEALAGPDLSRLGVGGAVPAPSQKPAPSRTIILSAPLPERLVVSPPVEQVSTATEPPPLHETAAQKIDHIEAEIAFITVSRHAAPDDVQVPAYVPRVSALPAIEAVELTDSPEFGSRDDIEEADVEIIVGSRPKTPMLAPLPALLLQRPSPGTPDRTARRVAQPPRGAARVEEAAVVIVRRSAEPAANALPFYAASKSKPEPGPLRRFVRALAGS